MFVATVINFLSFSLNAGSHAGGLVVFIRKVTILYIGYSPSKEQEILRPGWINVVIIWAAYIPVSIKPSPPHAAWRVILGGGICQRSHRHLEGLDPLPGSTVADPHTIYSVDWNHW